MATHFWVAIVNGVRRCPTLPQGPPCSTIGAESLSFRVRNVTGRFPLAIAAVTLATHPPHTVLVGVKSGLHVKRVFNYVHHLSVVRCPYSGNHKVDASNL